MTDQIKIKRNLKIGDLDAETDIDLLEHCFVDKGYISQLADVNDPTSVIIGRTGSGKSALLLKISKTTKKAVFLDPADVSIKFIENPDIIQFFNELGIKLDLFYRLLWRHVLTVEFLKLRYDIKSEQDTKNTIEMFMRRFERDHVKKKAFEYFNEWGDKFWLQTDEQLKAITKKLEKDTKENVGVKYSGIELSRAGAKKLSEEERTEISQRASQVVSGLQIKKLNEMLDLLAEHSFNDDQKKYFILIDKLDEDWANTETRCKFIRSLIEEIKTYRRIKNVKIIAAIRRDLLDLVFDATRDSGFQEEKYDSYLLEIRWTAKELTELIELRINEVFSRQYTKRDIKFEDIFPKPRKGGGQKAVEFIIERTLLRPRDVLQFINECFAIAYERERISWRAMLAAEAQYSIKRLKSLKEEWGEIFPEFITTAEIIRGLPASFVRTSIGDEKLQEVALALYDGNIKDPCVAISKRYIDDKGIKESDLYTNYLACLYRVGAIGIKISSLNTFVWSNVDQSTIGHGEIKRSEKIKVHKMLHRALEVILEQKDIFESEDLDS